VCNLSEIVHGVFKSAYLGYYAFAGAAGRGLMSAGLALVLDAAFGELGLHRVEANVQPENARSLAFLARNGFTREGYSRRYLKIGGRWRDHVRFAMLAEDWRARRR
jgi:ribosomal-protein-alanine N-acetyltransferase